MTLPRWGPVAPAPVAARLREGSCSAPGGRPIGRLPAAAARVISSIEVRPSAIDSAIATGLLMALALAGGCGTIELPNGLISCPDGSCPSGMTCTGGVCSNGQQDGDATPAPDAAGPINLVFVTSSEQTGASLGGLTGADAICNNLAAAAGLPGTYV